MLLKSRFKFESGSVIQSLQTKHVFSSRRSTSGSAINYVHTAMRHFIIEFGDVNIAE